MWLTLGNLNTKAANFAEGEREWLSGYLSFDNAQARYIKNLRGDGKIHMFNMFSDSFPTGFVPLVVDAAEREGFKVEILDRRRKPCEPDPQADLGWLRDYQTAAVDAVVDKTRGIIWAPTGSGKGTMVAGLVLRVPCRWLYLVHRTTLVRQQAERIEQQAGIECAAIGEGAWEGFGRARVVCASFQTVYARLRRPEAQDLLEGAEAIAIDECFPAGTLVGKRAIEKLRPGDLVPAYHESSNRLCLRRVAQRFVSRPRGLVRLFFASGHQLVCTPGHQFLTRTGWRTAKSLCGLSVLSWKYENASLLTVWNKSSAHDDERKPKSLLHTMSSCAMERTTKDYRDGMRHMWRPDQAIGTARTGPCPAAQNVLFNELSKRGYVDISNKDCNALRTHALSANEISQPDEKSGNAFFSERHITKDEARAEKTRWQRDGAFSTARKSFNRALRRSRRLDCGIRGPHETCFWAAEWCKTRPRASVFKNSYRSRWAQSPSIEASRSRPPQREISSLCRVDRVEILEPGSDGTYGGLCPDGLVYNIEVEDAHTYLVADGFVAHNCHTQPSETYWKVSQSTPNAYYRVGLSGTPLARGDRRSVLAIATLGKVIYRIKPDVLIEAGVLAKPRIRMIPIYQEADNPTWQGVYGELVVRSRQRNAAVVAAVKAAEKPCLVFVRELKHGRLLEQQLGKAGLSVSFVSGQHSTEWRASHLKRLERGHFDALLASVVLQEGVDVPQLRSVVVACGGASVIAALQRIGRGMRVAAGKSEFEVWDFADSGQNWMERHARARRLAYSREGFQVTEEAPVIGAVA